MARNPTIHHRLPPLAGVHSPDSPIWLGFERAVAQTDRPRDLRSADKLPQLDLEDERGILVVVVVVVNTQTATCQGYLDHLHGRTSRTETSISPPRKWCRVRGAQTLSRTLLQSR